MQKILDTENNRKYNENGFFIVSSFLTTEEVKDLTGKLQSKAVDRAGFYTSTCIDDKEYREYCNQSIKEVVTAEKIAAFLKGYTVFYTNFINKTAHSESEVVLHTDWSIMDETRFNPFKIWIPLVDVGTANGGFTLVSGSHKMTNKHRGFHANEYYVGYSKEIIDNCLTVLNLKAGDALFYHPGLLHYSPPNRSDADRPAMLISLAPEGVQPVLYYKNWYNFFNTMSVYKFLPEFMNTWDKQSKPEALEYIKTIRENNKAVPRDTFVGKFKTAR